MSKFRNFFKQIKDDPQLQGTVNQIKASASVVGAYLMLVQAVGLKEKRKRSEEKSLEAKEMQRSMLSMEKSINSIEGMMRDKLHTPATSTAATSAAGAATTISSTNSPIKEIATIEVPAADLSTNESN